MIAAKDADVYTFLFYKAMEVFPTNIRQSGIGFATLISQTISIGGPYVIYLGATDLKLPYMVMFLICLVGAVSVSFLPETLNCKLPETLAEASSFGTEDKYFSLRCSCFLACRRTNRSGEVVLALFQTARLYQASHLERCDERGV